MIQKLCSRICSLLVLTTGRHTQGFKQQLGISSSKRTKKDDGPLPLIAEEVKQQQTSEESQQLFKQGKISAGKLQKLDPTSTGSSSSNNVSRDEIRRLNRLADYPEVYEAKIDLYDETKGGDTRMWPTFNVSMKF